MEEIWQTVRGYHDYLISNCGRVKTKSRPLRYVHAISGNEHFRISTERYLKKYKTKQGYDFVQLYKNEVSKNLTIHRLVALTFLENPKNFEVVNHIDGNKLNNRVDNLEWCTDAYNHKHAMDMGLLAKGSNVGTSKLDERSVHAIRKLLAINLSHILIAEMFLVSRATISLIAENKTWKHVALTGIELEIKL